MKFTTNLYLKLRTVAKFRWFWRNGPWFFNTSRYSSKYPLFKDVDDSSMPHKRSYWLTKQHTASINWHNISLIFFTCSHALGHIFYIECWGAGQPSVVFQIVLTVDNSAHKFVILSAFVAHLTNYLNSRSHVYSVHHAHEKK